jgi:hypothetical protein
MAPEIANSTSAGAVLAFLKQAALEPSWDLKYVSRALGVNAVRAREAVAQLAAAGYIAPASRRHDHWRTTEVGDTVSGAKAPRLARATADAAVDELKRRIDAFNAAEGWPLRVSQAIAFGGYTTTHDRIQDVDVGVVLEPKAGRHVTPNDRRVALRQLRGKGRALKLHRLEGWMLSAPGLVIYSAPDEQRAPVRRARRVAKRA